jgi:hypothetical protein
MKIVVKSPDIFFTESCGNRTFHREAMSFMSIQDQD